KYLVLYPHKSYHTQFPDSEEGAGAPHVKNFDSGKGLKKAGGGYYNGDSYWVDLGFPIMTAPNGKRFKPLFAALVIDLDGKINLNAAGNIRGVAQDASGNVVLDTTGNPVPTHASNHGLQPWEINLSRAFDPTKKDPTTTQPEWINLFRGNNPLGLPG